MINENFKRWYHPDFFGTVREAVFPGLSAEMTPSLYLDVQIYRPSSRKGQIISLQGTRLFWFPEIGRGANS
jgi:hypothetical protein